MDNSFRASNVPDMDDAASFASSDAVNDEESELAAFYESQKSSISGQRHAELIKSKAKEHRVLSKRALRTLQPLLSDREKAISTAWDAFCDIIGQE